jgi:hypothetical protein
MINTVHVKQVKASYKRDSAIFQNKFQLYTQENFAYYFKIKQFHQINIRLTRNSDTQHGLIQVLFGICMGGLRKIMKISVRTADGPGSDSEHLTCLQI